MYARMYPTYLCGEDMFHFTGSNPKRQRSKCPVCGRVRISAHRDTPRQGKALFRSNNVNNPLTFVGKGKVFESKISYILFQLQYLRPTGRFFNKGFNINQSGPIRCRDIVIDCHQSTIRSTDTASRQTQTFKRLGRCHFVDQVAVNVDQSRLTVVIDQMFVPYLVVQGARTGGSGVRRCPRRRTSCGSGSTIPDGSKAEGLPQQ